MIIVGAIICTTVFLFGAGVAAIPCVITYLALRAIINLVKRAIKVHAKIDDDLV